MDKVSSSEVDIVRSHVSKGFVVAPLVVAVDKRVIRPLSSSTSFQKTRLHRSFPQIQKPKCSLFRNHFAGPSILARVNCSWIAAGTVRGQSGESAISEAQSAKSGEIGQKPCGKGILINARDGNRTRMRGYPSYGF